MGFLGFGGGDAEKGADAAAETPRDIARLAEMMLGGGSDDEMADANAILDAVESDGGAESAITDAEEAMLREMTGRVEAAAEVAAESEADFVARLTEQLGAEMVANAASAAELYGQLVKGDNLQYVEDLADVNRLKAAAGVE